MTRPGFILGFLLLAGSWTPLSAQPPRSEIRKALNDSICSDLGMATFKGCRPGERIGGPGTDGPYRIAGDILAGKRRFTVLSYRTEADPERDLADRGTPDCGVSVLERIKGKLAYLGHYKMACMEVRIAADRVVFDKPPAKFDEMNFFVLDEKGPPPAIYIFGGYYTFND